MRSVQNKRKICINTLIGSYNYGNRLQHFALDRLLRQEGMETVYWSDFHVRELSMRKHAASWKQTVKRLVPYRVYLLFMRVGIAEKQFLQSPDLAGRKMNFRRFNRQYLPNGSRMYAKTLDTLHRKIAREGIDFFIAGSDQVWNPRWNGNGYQFLNFAPPSRRLSFSASFGIQEIPENLRAEYAGYLADMRYISVREQRGVEIVKELTGRDAELTPDPTLLLQREEWDKAVDTVRMALPEQYIAAYFLGETPKAVYDFAKKKGLPLIELNRRDRKKWYSVDPLQFLYILRSARYVLTDSFHGTAFSLKFEKEFYVFRRSDGAGMFSRIETLASMFDLWDRVQDETSVREALPVTEEKWRAVRDELEQRRALAMEGLMRAMDVRVQKEGNTGKHEA